MQGEAADPYPVMFWIYGGAYQQGGTVTYPGHYLASRGVVVVTVNYRMGKFGKFHWDPFLTVLFILMDYLLLKILFMFLLY